MNSTDNRFPMRNNNVFQPPETQNPAVVTKAYTSIPQNEVKNPTVSGQPNWQPMYVKQLSVQPAQKSDFVFAAIFFACTFLVFNFAFFAGFNLGATIAFVITFIAATAYFILGGFKPNVFAVCCGTLSLAGWVVFALSRDINMNNLMAITCIFLFAVYLSSISGNIFSWQGGYRMLGDIIKNTVVSPFSEINRTYKSYKSAGKSGDKSKNNNLLYIFIGLLIAVPVLLLVVPILVISDAAYEGMMNRIMSHIGIGIVEFIFTLIAFPFVLTYFSALKRKANKPTYKAVKVSGNGAKVIPSSMAASFLSALSFFYLIYIVSQLAYFFSAFSGILPNGYRFNESEYARRGFFEMSFICGVNIAVIAVVMLFTRLKDGKLSMVNRLLCTFICVFNTLLITTALSKMIMYINCYGMTKLRITTSMFMIAMLTVMIILLTRIFVNNFPYMSMLIVICSAIIVISGFCNFDGMIAKYNFEAYQSGKLSSVDVQYLSTLSDSALPYIDALANDSDKNVAEEAKAVLAVRANDYEYSVGDEYRMDDFRWYNRTKKQAIDILKNYTN